MDIIEFAENVLHEDISEYQKEILIALERGSKIVMPRQLGKRRILGIWNEYHQFLLDK